MNGNTDDADWTDEYGFIYSPVGAALLMISDRNGEVSDTTDDDSSTSAD